MDTKNHAFRNLGCRHANLSLWRCLAHLQRRLGKKSMANMNFNQFVWLGIAVLDADANFDGFPDPGIAPVCESLGEYHRAAFFFLFNLVGLPTYPSLYDKFLLAVSLGFNVVTIWYAWNWS